MRSPARTLDAEVVRTGNSGSASEDLGASTEDYLVAIGQTRRTVSDVNTQLYDEDIAFFGRL